MSFDSQTLHGQLIFAYQIRGGMDKTIASLQAFLSFPPRAPHTLSRAPKFPLPLPLSTPATQATSESSHDTIRHNTDSMIESFRFEYENEY